MQMHLQPFPLQHGRQLNCSFAYSMSRPLSLLIAGLTMSATKRLNPQVDVQKFGQMLDNSIQSLDKIPGLYYQRFDLDHDAPSESPESLASFQRTIKQGPPQGGEWDAYVY